MKESLKLTRKKRYQFISPGELENKREKKIIQLGCKCLILFCWISASVGQMAQNCSRKPQKKPKPTPDSVYTHTKPDKSLPEQLVQVAMKQVAAL